MMTPLNANNYDANFDGFYNGPMEPAQSTKTNLK